MPRSQGLLGPARNDLPLALGSNTCCSRPEACRPRNRLFFQHLTARSGPCGPTPVNETPAEAAGAAKEEACGYQQFGRTRLSPLHPVHPSDGNVVLAPCCPARRLHGRASHPGVDRLAPIGCIWRFRFATGRGSAGPSRVGFAGRRPRLSRRRCATCQPMRLNSTAPRDRREPRM